MVSHIPVRKLLGVGDIPSHRTSASKWPSGNGIPIRIGKSKGGKAEFVKLSDLPDDIRRAYLEREVERAGLPLGLYDEEAHASFSKAAASMQETAERRAAIARVLLTIGDEIPWADRHKIVQHRFGSKGTSIVTLRRILNSVKNVDPINFAPALLPSFTGRTVQAETTPEA